MSGAIQPELIPEERRFATFSDDRVYRYLLEIEWNSALPICMVIGLNPSTADEFKDDPTLRRVKDFAKSWGYGTLLMANLFAYRATQPKDMLAAANPVGELLEAGQRNDIQIVCAARRSELVVAAWGNHGRHLDRGRQVRAMLQPMKCLGVNVDGTPVHPLYQRWDTKLIDFHG